MNRYLKRMATLAVALFAVPLFSFTATAQLAVSANDNKVVNVDGKNVIVQNAPADTVTIVDLGAKPPKVIGEVKAPVSVVGPPQSVAVSRDESFALVTGAVKIDPADPKKTTANNQVSVIDLKANPPAVIATVEAGAAPSGLSINPAGTLALVANRNDGTVSIFTIANKTLTAAGKVDFGNPKSGPSHVAFSPDGKIALVTRDGDHRISLLSVDGNKVEDTKKFMVGGFRPYSFAISPKGDVAVLTNQGGGQGDIDVITVIDLKQNPPRLVDTISVGQTPEGATMSPDGSHVAITIQNGSPRPKTHQAHNDHGLLKIFSINGTKLTLVAEAKVGGWGQGVVWSKDGKTLLHQSMMEKALEVISFDGKTLKKTGAIKVNGGPSGIRTALD
ncbi:MAG: YncE family protein [Deltaproteobacteria bacterium]|nr:YncE family protein [Deltaproteobacteria bacterium]